MDKLAYSLVLNRSVKLVVQGLYSDCQCVLFIPNNALKMFWIIYHIQKLREFISWQVAELVRVSSQ